MRSMTDEGLSPALKSQKPQQSAILRRPHPAFADAKPTFSRAREKGRNRHTSLSDASPMPSSEALMRAARSIGTGSFNVPSVRN
jgi:hypothetical protein